MQFDPKVNPKAEDILRGLYEFKQSLIARNKAFSKEEFLAGLKSIGIPSNGHFWMTILNFVLPEQGCKLLTRVRKNGYVFTKPKDPIYHGDLQALYDAYSATVKKYQQNHLEKKKAISNEDKEKFDKLLEDIKDAPTENKNEQLPKQVREAIDLLKSHGFEVLAPVATLYIKM